MKLDFPSALVGFIAGILAVTVAIFIAIPLKNAQPPAAENQATPLTTIGPTPSAATPTPALTSTPTVPVSPGPTASIAPPGVPLTFTGSSDKKTKPFELDGSARVDYMSSGSGNFIVDLDQQGGRTVASIANLIGKARVTTWVYGSSGVVYLDVLANGAWKITVTPERPNPQSVPIMLTGRSDLTTGTVTLTGSETLEWACKGDGNFIVELIDPATGSDAEGVVNVIGNGSDTTQIESHGDYAFDVTANGPWTIRIIP